MKVTLLWMVDGPEHHQGKVLGCFARWELALALPVCVVPVVAAAVVSWGCTKRQGKYPPCIAVVCLIHNLCY